MVPWLDHERPRTTDGQRTARPKKTDRRPLAHHMRYRVVGLRQCSSAVANANSSTRGRAADNSMQFICRLSLFHIWVLFTFGFGTVTAVVSAFTFSAGADEMPSPSEPVHIAYAGNSMIYFHDTPRMFTNLATKRRVASQDSCLRGGASLPSLFLEGNGMKNKFRTLRKSEVDIGSPTVSEMLSSKQSDFLVMNDYTQAPARMDLRQKTIASLQSDYLPLIQKCGATPVFIITPAYRKPVNNSIDLGSPEEFTMRTKQGCEAYASALDESLPETQKCRVAPVGLAFLKIRRENPTMWERLFHVDDFHPSPHGTFLQGCVLHWTLFGCGPDIIDYGNGASSIEHLWNDARVMQPPSDDPLPLPTTEEATYLAKIAEVICREYLGIHAGIDSSRDASKL